MPAFVDPTLCNACESVHGGPQCVYICPGDLMVLDVALDKGLNREPEMCSECFACIKLCPEGAIEARGYSDFVPLGASVKPTKTDNEIDWVVKFRDGRTLEFTYPVRSTPVGSSEPYKGFPEPDLEELHKQGLAGEIIWLNVDQLPTLSR